MYLKSQATVIFMSISTNEYMFIEGAKVNELIYFGNTVLFLLPMENVCVKTICVVPFKIIDPLFH